MRKTEVTADGFTRKILRRGGEMEGATWFVVTDGVAAVQFAYLPIPGHEGSLGANIDGVWVLGMDVGYHQSEPMWEDQKPMGCDHLRTGECFYDGSSLAADAVIKEWAQAGASAEWMWDYLTLLHRERFGG